MPHKAHAYALAGGCEINSFPKNIVLYLVYNGIGAGMAGQRRHYRPGVAPGYFVPAFLICGLAYVYYAGNDPPKKEKHYYSHGCFVFKK